MKSALWCVCGGGNITTNEKQQRLERALEEILAKLLRSAAPYLQDLIRFALNTGLRTGEIFTLRWSNVDFEKSILTVFAPKTQKTRDVPINSGA